MTILLYKTFCPVFERKALIFTGQGTCLADTDCEKVCGVHVLFRQLWTFKMENIFITADIQALKFCIILQSELVILAICAFMVFIRMPLVIIEGYLKKNKNKHWSQNFQTLKSHLMVSYVFRMLVSYVLFYFYFFYFHFQQNIKQNI